MTHYHHQSQTLALSLLTMICSGAIADTNTTDDTSVWQHSRQQINQLWQQSRTTAQTWWQQHAAPTRANENSADAHAHQLWTTVLPTLNDTLTLHDTYQTLPEQAWLRRDRQDVDREITALLDEAVALLSDAPVQQYRARMRELEQTNDTLRQQIDEYRQQRIGALETAALQTTRSGYDRLIAAHQATIARNTQTLTAIKREFAQELRRIGLMLTDQQVEFLLTTVVGDNLLDLGVVFDNIKMMTTQLGQLVQDSGDDLRSSRRYYGLYVILLRVLKHMHLRIEHSITSDYIPRIDTIQQRAQALRQETQALQQAQPEQAAILTANLAAQTLTIQTAQLYRNYLEQQEAQIRTARLSLERDLATALNTYETVRISGEFIQLVRASQQLLDSLFTRHMPPLQPFHNLAMKQEFEKLTHQLRAHQYAAN